METHTKEVFYDIYCFMKEKYPWMYESEEKTKKAADAYAAFKENEDKAIERAAKEAESLQGEVLRGMYETFVGHPYEGEKKDDKN